MSKVVVEYIRYINLSLVVGHETRLLWHFELARSVL